MLHVWLLFWHLLPACSEYVIINDKICKKPHFASNNLYGLPRINPRTGKAVEKNWGYYDFYTCKKDRNGDVILDAKGKPDCNFINPQEQINILIDGGSGSADYIAGIAFYLVVALFMAIFTLILGFLICIGRCCCRCWTCCGGLDPTRKSEDARCPCNKLGFVEMRKADGSTKTFGYPNKFRWATRAFMWFFVLMVFIWIGKGHVGGSKGVTVALKAVVAAPDPIVSTFVGIVGSINRLFDNIVGKDVVNIMGGFNTTIGNSVDLDAVFDGVECVVDVVNGIPSLDVIGNRLQAEINKLTNISDLLKESDTQMDALDANAATTSGYIQDLYDITDYVDTAIVSIQTSINDAKSTVTALETFQNGLLDNVTGIQSMIDDLQKLSDGSAPATADVHDVAGYNASQSSFPLWPNAIPQSLQSVYDNPTEDPHIQTAADRLNVTNKLDALLVKYNGLPDFNQTANNMMNYNKALDDFAGGNATAEIVDALNRTDYALKDLTNANIGGQVKDTINNLIESLNNYSWDGVRGFLTSVENRINNISLDGFAVVLDGIIDIPKLQRCFNSLLEQVENVNASLFVFPDGVNDAVNQLQSFNQTFNDVQTMKKDLLSSFDNFFGNAGNLTEFKNNIDDAENQADSAGNDVRNGSLTGEIDSLLNSTNLGTDLQDLIGNIKNLTQTIGGQDTRIDQVLIDSLRNLSRFINTVTAQIPLTIADYREMDQGYCNGTGASSPFNCSIDADCGAGQTCLNKDTRRCKDEPFKNCVSDKPTSVCATRCLADQKTLQFKLVALDEVLTIDYSPAINAMVKTKNQLVTTLDENIANLDEAKAKADNISTSSIRDSLQVAKDGIASVNISKYRNEFSSHVDNLQKVLNSSDMMDGVLGDFNQSLDMVKQVQDMLNKTQQFSKVLRMIFLDPPGCNLTSAQGCGELRVWLKNLSKAELQKLSGLDTKLLRIGEVGDAAIEFMGTEQDMFPLKPMNLTDKLKKFANILKVISYPEYTNYGAFHFFLSVMEAANATGDKFTVLPSGYNKSFRLKVDISGNKYPDNQTCFTRKCLDNEIDYYGDEPVENLLVPIGAAGVVPKQVPLKMSPVNTVSLPFVLPAFIAIFGLIASLLICEGSGQDFCSKFLATCATCLMFCMMPFVFLLAGSFFMMPLIVGDTCLGIENVGYQVFSQQGDAFCTDMIGGTGTLRSCNVHVSGGDNTTNTSGSSMMPSLTLTIDMLETYKQVLGECTADDPIKPLFNSIAASTEDFLPGLVDEKVKNQKMLRQPLKDVVLDGSEGLTNSTVTFINDLSENIDCGSLNTIYLSFKGALCCESLSAIYWMIASWYLIGWSFLCCGCWAGFLGRKRFPSRLWGKHYKKALTATENEGDGEDDYEFEDDFDKKADSSQFADLEDHHEGDLPMAEPLTMDEGSEIGGPSRNPSSVGAALNPGYGGQQISSPTGDPKDPKKQTNADDDEIEI